MGVSSPQYGLRFLSQLRKCLLMENNTKEIFYAAYCLMTLVTLEDGEEGVRIDMIHFCLELQVSTASASETIFFRIVVVGHRRAKPDRRATENVDDDVLRYPRVGRGVSQSRVETLQDRCNVSLRRRGKHDSDSHNLPMPVNAVVITVDCSHP